MSEPLIRIVDIEKTYTPSETTPVSALNGVSLDIERGEFVALTGASGSGKSTLLNLLGLLDTPTNGEIIINGQNIYSLNKEQRTDFRLHTIGFVFQFFNLIENYTASENIIFQLELQGKSTLQAKQKALEILEYLGLKDKADFYPKNLSGGEQQRVAIGRAIAKESLIILADEPTAHLDSKSSALVMNLLHQVNKKFGSTVILVTHEPNQAEAAQKKVVMQDGHILSVTSPTPPGETTLAPEIQ